MAEHDPATYSGEFQSPGGFTFGVQGWTWGDQKPTSITFFLNGTATVCDQHGRPMKGVVRDGRAVYFAKCTHAQVIEALAEERVDWRNLILAGWPQLPYERLKELAAAPVGVFKILDISGQSVRLNLPDTPVEELRKIADPQLRKDALRIRREVEAERNKEMQATEEE